MLFLSITLTTGDHLTSDFLMGTNLLARHGVIIADNVLFKGMVSMNVAYIIYLNFERNRMYVHLSICIYIYPN